MKKVYNLISLILLLAGFLFSGTILAQEDTEEKRELRPVRSTFESIWLIDNQTVDVPFQGTFEWDIQHRFGTINNGYDDYFGLAAPSNIRLGFNYILLNNLQMGFGITKERKVWDFTLKYALLRQKIGGGSPISISYYVIAAIDSRDLEFSEIEDRLSYFHQVMIARKFTDGISLQIAPSISYFNSPDRYINNQGISLGIDNMHFSISAQGKLGISDSKAIIFSADLPLTNHKIRNLDLDVDPKENISIGFEFTSSGHAFQIFITNYRYLVPQYNHVMNQNQLFRSDSPLNNEGILIGFNLTRLWSL